MIYQFKSYCDNGYISLTTKNQLKKSVKELIPGYIDKFFNLAEIEKNSNKTMNAIKRSVIEEYLSNNKSSIKRDLR